VLVLFVLTLVPAALRSAASGAQHDLTQLLVFSLTSNPTAKPVKILQSLSPAIY
jgi:hypothetical protein